SVMHSTHLIMQFYCATLPPSDSVVPPPFLSLFFFTAPATTEIYTLSLHDALPIYGIGYADGYARRGRCATLVFHRAGEDPAGIGERGDDDVGQSRSWGRRTAELDDLRDGRYAVRVQDEKQVVARRGQIRVRRCHDVQTPRRLGEAQRVDPLVHVERVGHRAEPDPGDLCDVRRVGCLHEVALTETHGGRNRGDTRARSREQIRRRV